MMFKNKAMNIQLIQKHLLFIIVAIIFIFLISCQKEANRTTSAKIIYTDIIPDTIVIPTSTTPIYDLDLDKDGVYDFTFESILSRTQCRATGGSGFRAYIEVKPADNSFNAILNVVNAASIDTVPAALDTVNQIGAASGEWSSASSQFLRYKSFCTGGISDPSIEYGEWPDNIDKYLGLKLVKGNQVFYGWVRLNVQVGIGYSLMLKDYSYNDSPNEFILAGQKE